MKKLKVTVEVGFEDIGKIPILNQQS